jgi:hypothetical protein
MILNPNIEILNKNKIPITKNQRGKGVQKILYAQR